MEGIGDDFMAVVSAILIVLTFIVNFILDFPFFWIGYQFAYYFMPAEKFLTGNDQVIFLSELTCLAIFILQGLMMLKEQIMIGYIKFFKICVDVKIQIHPDIVCM